MGPAVAPSNDMKVLVSLDPSGVSAGAICGHGSGPKTLPKKLAFDVLVAAAAIAAVIVAVDVFAVFVFVFYFAAQRVGLVMLLPFGVYFTSLVASASTDLEICNFRYHWAEPAYYPDARLRCLGGSSGMQMWHVPAQQPQHITSPFACGPARMPAWK